MLTLTGEIRGVTKQEYTDKPTKHYVIIEDEQLNRFKVGLTEDHARSGFPNQIHSMRGSIATVNLTVGSYNGNLFYRYEGNQLPQVKGQNPAPAPVKKAG